MISFYLYRGGFAGIRTAVPLLVELGILCPLPKEGVKGRLKAVVGRT